MSQNPVLHAEFRYQRYVIDTSRSGRIWILLAILLVGPSILISIGYSIGLLLGLFPVIEWSSIPQTPHLNVLFLLIVVNISMYVVVTLVTIGLANRSISREKVKHTWGLLRLTEVSNTQIVLGKWWASLWALNGDHAMVILLRVGLLASYLAIFLPSLHAIDDIQAPYTLYFLGFTGVLIVQGFFDAMLSAILGVLGAIPDDTWRTVATFTVMMLRLIFSIMVGIWFVLILQQLQTDWQSALWLAGIGTISTIGAVIVCVSIAQALIDRT